MMTIRSACTNPIDPGTLNRNPICARDMKDDDSSDCATSTRPQSPNLSEQSHKSHASTWTNTVTNTKRISSKKPPLPPRLAKQSVTVIELDDDDFSGLSIGVTAKTKAITHDQDIDVVDQYVSSSSSLSSVLSLSPLERSRGEVVGGDRALNKDSLMVDPTCVDPLDVNLNSHCEQYTEDQIPTATTDTNPQRIKRRKRNIRWLYQRRNSRSDAFLCTVWNWSLSVLRKCRLSVASLRKNDDICKPHSDSRRSDPAR